MRKVRMLRALMNERQAAAAEQICELFERSIAEHRDIWFSREEIDRRPEVQQVIVGEQAPSEQQEWRTSLDQKPPHMKVDQEELWSSQEEEQLQRPAPKDDDEEAQSSQLGQRRADEPIKAEADGEDCEASEPARKLKVFVMQRLTAAAGEIFGLFETTLAEYEEEIQGLRKLLEGALKLEVRINTTDVPQLLVPSGQQEWRTSVDLEDQKPPHIKEEAPSGQQEWRTSVDLEDQKPPLIKEEQEELWSSQEGEQLQGLEEGDTTRFPVTAVPVKSEDDKGEAQSSQLHRKHMDEQMETGAEGQDCGGPEPAGIFGPACDLQQEADEKTSCVNTSLCFHGQKNKSQPQSGLGTPNYNEDSVNHKESVKTVAPNMRVNTGGKPFICSICGKGFSEKSNLKRHIRFHIGEKPFSCIFCEKSFSEKADLKRHMRIHTGEKPFSCPICGKSFCEKTDLTRHIRVHTGEKPFSCSVCGKIFSQNENLHRHERIHTGERPFSCPVCAKKFTHRGALVVHVRIHTGEKPFGCSVCGKRYTGTGNLKTHMRVHTGEKPFSCSVCARRFNYQSQVKQHKCCGESSRALGHQKGGEPKPPVTAVGREAAPLDSAPMQRAAGLYFMGRY